MFFRVNNLQGILGCLKNETLIYGWSEQTSLKPAHNSGSFKSKFFCFINSFDEAFMFISICLHHTISGFRKFKGQVTFLKNEPKHFQRLFCRAFLHETEWSNGQKTSQPSQKFQHLIFSTVISTYTSRPTVDGSVAWFPIAWKGKVNMTDSSAKDFSLWFANLSPIFATICLLFKIFCQDSKFFYPKSVSWFLHPFALNYFRIFITVMRSKFHCLLKFSTRGT